MGRKTPAGFSLFAALALFLIAAGCRQDPSLALDPAARFSSSGEGKSRELGIYSGDLRVGDLRFSLRDGKWDGTIPATELHQSLLLRVSFKGQAFTIRSLQNAWADGDLGLLGSDGWVDFGAGRWEVRSRAAGEGRFETVQKTAGGRPVREMLEVPEGVLSSDVLPLFLHRLPPGDRPTGKMTIFNMNLGQEIPFSWADGGQTPFGRVFTVSYWGMEEKIWLDPEGMVVREEMLLGVQARKPGEGEARGDLPLESILSTASVPGIGVPEDLRDLREATLALEGSFRTPPEDRWQEVSVQGARTLVRISRPLLENAGEENKNDGRMGLDDFALDLDSERIIELSERITQGLESPLEKGRAVCQWVHGNLAKSMKESFSALQVLETGEGECQSHSLLAVSLCRLSGVPARFAYGVVYMPERRAFLFHTWVQIYAGEWIPMDPTFGDFPAGVDHLTLAVGGYRDQFRVFPFIAGTGGWRITFVGPE